MKKVLILTLAVAFAFGMFIMNSDAGIEDTYHDFGLNSNAWNIENGTTDALGTGSDQICVFCHHPHRSSGSGTIWTNEVLWNQENNNVDFATYTSLTLNATSVNVDSTQSMRSYLCLACHDGDIANGALIAAPREGTNITTGFTLSWGNLGPTLEDDHPVNIDYDLNTDAGLAAGTAVNTAGYPLYAGKVQCATCHDVHNGANSELTVQFMRKADWNANSLICVTCHTNK